MQRHSDGRNDARNFHSVHKEGQRSFYRIYLCKEKMKKRSIQSQKKRREWRKKEKE
jgi:hypothetical protein